MRVAVSALGPGLDERVDERFGRAAYLLIVDTETLEFETLDNSTNREALQGSGIGAAEAVSQSGASAVITGHLGPKAFRALRHAGISGHSGTGLSVRQAVEAFVEGKLEPLDEGEAHAGMG